MRKRRSCWFHRRTRAHLVAIMFRSRADYRHTLLDTGVVGTGLYRYLPVGDQGGAVVCVRRCVRCRRQEHLPVPEDWLEQVKDKRLPLRFIDRWSGLEFARHYHLGEGGPNHGTTDACGAAA